MAMREQPARQSLSRLVAIRPARGSLSPLPPRIEAVQTELGQLNAETRLPSPRPISRKSSLVTPERLEADPTGPVAIPARVAVPRPSRSPSRFPPVKLSAPPRPTTQPTQAFTPRPSFQMNAAAERRRRREIWVAAVLTWVAAVLTITAALIRH